MTPAEIVKHRQSESDAANECIVEILESYMEFVDIFEKTIPMLNNPEILPYIQALIDVRRKHWIPILEHCKKIS